MNPKIYIDPDIRKAETLPPEFYRSNEIFEKLRDRVFLTCWHWLGDDSELRLPGRVEPFTLLDQFLTEPLVLTTNSDGKISLLSNVCTHRANRVVEDPGEVRKLICRYHGRKFDLEGRFESMPEFSEAQGFPRGCDSLHSFPLIHWGPWLFAGLGTSVDMHKVISIMEEHVGFLPLDQFVHDGSMDRDYLVNAHWALYCDNYLEGFHIPFVHKDLNQALDYGTYESRIFDHCNLQVGFADKGTECFELPSDHRDHGKNVAAYYFWVFPNMMFNFYPWGLSVNVVKPLTKDRTRVSFITYVLDPDRIANSAGALVDKVEREDEEVVESVQKGVRSHFYQGGRFSPTREKGVHHFHRLLAEAVS